MSVLNSILRMYNPSNLSVYTQKGPKNLEDFSVLNQLRLLRDIYGILEYYTPTTLTVNPLAHALFKI